MEFLKDILGDSYADFEGKITKYNTDNPDKSVKLANLSDGGYVSKQKYTDLESEVNGYKDQIKDRDKQLENLKKSPDSGKNLKETIEQLQQTNKAEKEKFEKQLSELRFNSTLGMELLKAKAIDSDLVKVKLNMDALELAEDGSIAGLKEQLEGIRENYGFLFETETKIDGVKPADSGTEMANDPFLQGFEG